MQPTKRTILRARPYFSDEDIADALTWIDQSLRTGQLLMGPAVEEFEFKFAHSAGVKYAIAVSSGTAALEIALRCIGIEDREIIVPTETFVASANSVLLAGGRPVFAEIHPDTLCLDLADVVRRIGPKTAGVMVVHMAGLIQPDIETLLQVCQRHGLFLIEDAAHAHGAEINGRKAGSIGKAGCFSFYPTKLMTTGEGGMITTDDADLAELARSYRNHGAAARGSEYVRVSTNWRLPEISAILGLVQLRHLEEFVERRNQIAVQYDQALAVTSGIRPLFDRPKSDTRHSYWNYLAVLDEDIDRVELARLLRDEYAIPIAWPYDPPCHLQPVFRDALGCQPGELPQSEHALRHHIALPMHVVLSDDDVSHIVAGLRATLPRARTA